MSEIINEIFKNNSFTEEELAFVYSKFKLIQLKKGEFLLQPHESVDKLYYVYDGCLRSYIVDWEGKEHTLQFAIKDWWISDYIALFGRKKIPSVLYIECIKDATIYTVQKNDFDDLCRDIPNMAQMHIRKMELAFAGFQNRILTNLTLPARERYTHFIQSYPTIANDVKNFHIASYLGITTESLSRIRKKLSNK